MKNLLPIAGIAFGALFASCNSNTVNGNGKVVTQAYNNTEFKDIEVGSVMKVNLHQGPNYKITINAEENILKVMKVQTMGSKLVVGFASNVNARITKEIIVDITAPEYRRLEASGASSFNSLDQLSGSEMNLELSGASKANLDVSVKKLSIEASGAAEIEVKGNAPDLDIFGSGGTSIKAFNLESSRTSVVLSGAGAAKVNSRVTLKVQLSGAATVKYKGNPATITKDISGAGNVTKAE